MFTFDDRQAKYEESAKSYSHLEVLNTKPSYIDHQNDLIPRSRQWEDIGAKDLTKSPLTDNLILRNCTLLENYITEVMMWRTSRIRRIQNLKNWEMPNCQTNSATLAPDIHVQPDSHFNEQVRGELRDFVTTIASMYNDVLYHKFEHATHVAESTDMMFSLITAAFTSTNGSSPTSSNTLHLSTYGLSSDRMVHLAMIFSAIVHDVEHQGVSNKQLLKEADPTILKYNNCSVAENNSIGVSFMLLNEERFSNMRDCMFGVQSECLNLDGNDRNDEQILKLIAEDKLRFQQVVIDVILGTDIASVDQLQLVESRWKYAFESNLQDYDENYQQVSLRECPSHHDDLSLEYKIHTPVNQVESLDELPIRGIESMYAFSDSMYENTPSDLCCLSIHYANVRAASVLELIIQAADVSHTMQSWPVFLKWNGLLLDELRAANDSQRGPDCTGNWFQGQLHFFDSYIFPLSRRLEQCKVFGVLGSLFYENAMNNRQRWLEEGEVICRNIISELI